MFKKSAKLEIYTGRLVDSYKNPLLKTFSAKFVGGRTKSSSFGQNSVLMFQNRSSEKIEI
jgi:hypothetical protein